MTKPRVEHHTLYFARILACIAVIVLHTLGQLTIPAVTPSAVVFSPNWLIQNLLDSFVIWAVPLFVMMSGTLLLNRKYESAKSFYESHLPKMAVITVFWFSLYAVADHLIRGDDLTPVAYIKRFIIGPYDHLYFLLIILGLYILVPFFSSTLAKISTREHLILTCIFLFISIFWKLSPFSLTMFVPYIGYFLAGAYLHKVALPKVVPKISPYLVFGWGLATFLFNLFGHLILHKESYYYLHHHNPLIIGLSLSVFVLLTTHPFFASLKLPHLKKISEMTLGIYLLHPFILSLLVLIIGSSYTFIMAIVLVPVIFIICYGLTAALKKLPVSIL